MFLHLKLLFYFWLNLDLDPNPDSLNNEYQYGSGTHLLYTEKVIGRYRAPLVRQIYQIKKIKSVFHKCDGSLFGL